MHRSLASPAAVAGGLSQLARALLPAAEFLALTALEIRRPLRRAVEDKARRFMRNLSFSALAAVAIQLAEMPVVLWLATLVDRHGWGLLPRLGLPPAPRCVLAVLAMDYTLYLWHVIVHKAPALWRLHRVHHADLDMDASTALRFHFAEHVASVPYRAAQVLLLGVTPGQFAIWQAFLMANVLFHHSNVRLPLWLERLLARVIITPRLHGIHHSSLVSERESNWSSGLSLWDRLHGTYVSEVLQGSIVIGLAEYRDPDHVRFTRLVTMPLDPPSR